jgi:flagellar biosynthesis protein FlhF
MRLRTFIAKDMREAMAEIRAEMGVEAVIISSQRAKGGGILVRAAVEHSQVETEAEDAVAAHAEALETAAALPAFDQQYHQGLIRRLRSAPPADETVTQPRNFNRAELLTILRSHRAPDALAPALAEAAEKAGMSDMTLALASALDQRMKTKPIELAKAGALLLTGPHGSGKTALAAKLAAEARVRGRAVKLIAGDTKGAGAVERLKTFAEHLDVGFAVAEDAGALANQIGECARDGTLAIIDTAGFDPRNGKARSAFAALTKIGGVEAIGVVSASGDAEELSEIVAALTSLGARRLVVTGLDMARRLGTLAAAAMATPALAHVTRSPFLGSGLETLTPLSLARALIDRNTQARNIVANPQTRSAS